MTEFYMQTSLNVMWHVWETYVSLWGKRFEDYHTKQTTLGWCS